MGSSVRNNVAPASLLSLFCCEQAIYGLNEANAVTIYFRCDHVRFLECLFGHKAMAEKDIIKKYLLRTMDSLHSFCEKNDLTYYIIGGTLLGAVRHKGFIPWDDDMDVVMPRADYNKFLTLSSSVEPPFSIRHNALDGDYSNSFAKFTNNDLIVQEGFFKPNTSGIWVDVFPLDYTFESMMLRKADLWSVKILRKVLSTKSGAFELAGRSEASIIRDKLVCHMGPLIPRFLLKYALEVHWKKSRYIKKKRFVANFHGAWGIKEIFPSHVYDARILYDFEGRQYWGPKNYEYILSQMYGDYMTPPPEDQRRTHVEEIVYIRESGD